MKRTREKHLPYFRVLEAFQRSSGCPLCSLEDAAVARYFEGILYEKINDPRIREELRRAAGFCPRHAHQLREFGDGLGTVILYQDQVRLIIHAVGKAISVPEKRRKSARPAPRERQAPCPACRFAEQVRSRSTQTLLESLDDREMLEAVRGSTGLCYPHLAFALDLANEQQRRQLVEIHRPKLSALLHLLEEYQRKQDYRFASESDAEERDSWLRAIETAVGRKGVF